MEIKTIIKIRIFSTISILVFGFYGIQSHGQESAHSEKNTLLNCNLLPNNGEIMVQIANKYGEFNYKNCSQIPMDTMDKIIKSIAENKAKLTNFQNSLLNVEWSSSFENDNMRRFLESNFFFFCKEILTQTTKFSNSILCRESGAISNAGESNLYCNNGKGYVYNTPGFINSLKDITRFIKKIIHGKKEEARTNAISGMRYMTKKMCLNPSSHDTKHTICRFETSAPDELFCDNDVNYAPTQRVNESSRNEVKERVMETENESGHTRTRAR